MRDPEEGQAPRVRARRSVAGAAQSSAASASAARPWEELPEEVWESILDRSQGWAQVRAASRGLRERVRHLAAVTLRPKELLQNLPDAAEGKTLQVDEGKVLPILSLFSKLKSIVIDESTNISISSNFAAQLERQCPALARLSLRFAQGDADGISRFAMPLAAKLRHLSDLHLLGDGVEYRLGRTASGQSRLRLQSLVVLNFSAWVDWENLYKNDPEKWGLADVEQMDKLHLILYNQDAIPVLEWLKRINVVDLELTSVQFSRNVVTAALALPFVRISPDVELGRNLQLLGEMPGLRRLQLHVREQYAEFLRLPPSVEEADLQFYSRAWIERVDSVLLSHRLDLGQRGDGRFECSPMWDYALFAGTTQLKHLTINIGAARPWPALPLSLLKLHLIFSKEAPPLQSLSRLTDLTLEAEEARALPYGLLHLTHLKALTIFMPELDALPDGLLRSIVGLERLHIEARCFVLPSEGVPHPRLKSLSLVCKEAWDLRGVGELTALTSLELWCYGPIHRALNWDELLLQNLKHLKTLAISTRHSSGDERHFSADPPRHLLRGLTALEDLTYSHGARVPELSDLCSLKSLTIRRATGPLPSLQGLDKLTSLAIWSQHLHISPQDLPAIRRLKRLDVPSRRQTEIRDRTIGFGSP